MDTIEEKSLFERTVKELDFLAGEVRIAYATYLQVRGVLPAGLKERLNAFYFLVDRACNEAGQSLAGDIEKCRNEARGLLIILNSEASTDYAFKA
jgi:hypothetical protein